MRSPWGYAAVARAAEKLGIVEAGERVWRLRGQEGQLVAKNSSRLFWALRLLSSTLRLSISLIGVSVS